MTDRELFIKLRDENYGLTYEVPVKVFAEHGMIVLPCNVGDTIFTIEKDYCNCNQYCIEEHVVKGFTIGAGGSLSGPCRLEYKEFEEIYGVDGKWYKTIEDAKNALQVMKEIN